MTTGVTAFVSFASVLYNNDIEDGYTHGSSIEGSVALSQGVHIRVAFVISDNMIDGESAVGRVLHAMTQGLYLVSLAPAWVVNNVIDGGVATASFGYDHADSYGISTKDGLVTILHNTIFAGRSSADVSAAHGISVNGLAHIVNNVIDGGKPALHSSSTSSAILVWTPSEIIVSYSDLFVHDGSNQCLVFAVDFPICLTDIPTVHPRAWSGCAQTTGNIAAYPVLADAFGHLSPVSPCVNTGINPCADDPHNYTRFDFEGDTRPYDAGRDMGADEWTP